MANAKFFRGSYGGIYRIAGDVPDFLKDATRITKAEFIAARKDQLKECIAEGDTLWTTVTQVARSGMSRRVKVYAIKDNEPINLSSWAADVLEWRHNDSDGTITVTGCGMDVCFHLVNSLAYSLFGDGYALSKRDM